MGRLENESAVWISTLLDQKLCVFEGVCVFGPDHLRINDTVYLQLRCYLLRHAFDANPHMQPTMEPRATGLFESKENQEERSLRLRQAALVKLFHETGLQPVHTDEQTEKQKRLRLLNALNATDNTPPTDADSSANPDAAAPASEPEDGQELEQDQLDTLYRKAQAFDFNMAEHEPAPSFALTLRKYQRQALHWLIGKEKDQQARERSMHPLWEEYAWPTRDVDGQEIDVPKHEAAFYVNHYSGEMSLTFPVQEQHSLGGILADGE